MTNSKFQILNVRIEFLKKLEWLDLENIKSLHPRCSQLLEAALQQNKKFQRRKTQNTRYRGFIRIEVKRGPGVPVKGVLRIIIMCLVSWLSEY